MSSSNVLSYCLLVYSLTVTDLNAFLPVVLSVSIFLDPEHDDTVTFKFPFFCYKSNCCSFSCCLQAYKSSPTSTYYIGVKVAFDEIGSVLISFSMFDVDGTPVIGFVFC